MSDQKTFFCVLPETKKRPHSVVVDEAIIDDNSVIALHPNAMDQLNLFRGDVILIKGKRRRDTICSAEPDDACLEGHHFVMVKRNPNWDQLNDDVVEEIAKKIKLYDDFTAFRGVCSSWRSAVNVKKDFKFMSSQLPWLLLPPKTCANNIYDFFSLSRGMSRQIVLPELHNNKYLCSKGWLLTINKHQRFSMLHPFTGAHIKLPPLPPLHALHDWNYCFGPSSQKHKSYANHIITKCVLSSNPSLTSDYMVTVTFGDFYNFLAYARSGDKQWTIILEHSDAYSDVTYYNGMIYGITFFCEIMACDVRDGRYPTSAQKVTAMPSLDCEKLYILESAGALLVVKLKFRVDSEPAYVFKFQVFDVNLSTNIWREVTHLGNRALFLSENSSLSVETTHTSYCQPNCIYFIDDCAEKRGPLQYFKPKYMAIYHMQSGRTEPYLKSNSNDRRIPLMWVEKSF